MWFLFVALLAQSANVVEDGSKALDAKQYDRAIELFTQAAAADPRDYAAQFQLALTYSLLGRDADAIPHYKATLGLKPGLYEAELNLGLSLLRTNDPVAAIPHFRAAVTEMTRRTGIERLVLQSTEAGYDLYRRMGFRDATRFSVYLTK